MAGAGRITAGERPNPSVSLTPTYDTTTPPPWILGVSFDIPIETAGKRGYRLAQARHLSDAARWNLVAAFWQVRSRVRATFDAESARDPNNVKVVTDAAGRALYFSRAQVPHDRDGSGRAQYFKHLGIYAFTAAALEKFHCLPPSPLEQLEKLEQLRFLKNGIAIAVVETPHDTIGVDTEEDLQRVEAYFRRLKQEPGR